MSAALKAAKMGSRGFRPGGTRAQGDPGFFGSLGRIAGGLLLGGPVGAAATFLSETSGLPGGRGGVPIPVSRATPTSRGAGRGFGGGFPMPQLGGPGGFQGPGTTVARSPRFNPNDPGMRGTVVAPPSNGAMGQPKGFHVNKSSYFLIDGTFVPAGSRWVKNRRRNALNPRALRRAISRIDAGKIWQGKLHEISTAKFTAAGNRKHPHA